MWRLDEFIVLRAGRVSLAACLLMDYRQSLREQLAPLIGRAGGVSG